jgi:hypothetical protein
MTRPGRHHVPRPEPVTNAHAIAPETDSLIRGNSKPLEGDAQATMERRFQRDFSSVRIHSDSHAAAAAEAQHARAFTVGQDIVFGANEYAPQTTSGRALLGHELAHTVQQGATDSGSSVAFRGEGLEASADAAGHDVAGGRVVSRDLPASGVGLARNLATPKAYDDEELPQAILRVAEKLKQPSYPGRENDVKWYQDLKDELEIRVKAKASALPPRPPPPPPPDPVKEREAAVAEAIAVTDRMDAAEKEDDDEPAARRKAPTVSPQFSPGGFTDHDIYDFADKEKARLDKELAPARDPRLFRERMKVAKKHAPPTTLPSDFPGSVLETGISEGLFAEKERLAVMEELEAPAYERAAEELRVEKQRAAYQQQLEGEAFIQNMNVNMIGAFATAPGRGFLAVTSRLLAAPQRAVSVAQGIRVGYDTVAKGDPSGLPDYAISMLPNLYFHGLARTPGGGGMRSDEPAPGTAGGAGSVVAEVRPNEVRQIYRANPMSVNKSTGSEWHQQQWERSGGTGKAPIAFRSDGMIRVDEVRWLAVGDLSEINSPADLRPAAVPAGGPNRSPTAFANTVDPLAQTPAPPARAPTPAPVPAGARTQNTQVPVAPGRGYARVPVEVAIEAYQINPNSIVESGSPDFHQMVWAHGGGRGNAPIAFRIGNGIRVNLERLTPAQAAALGYTMRL